VSIIAILYNILARFYLWSHGGHGLRHRSKMNERNLNPRSLGTSPEYRSMDCLGVQIAPSSCSDRAAGMRRGQLEFLHTLPSSPSPAPSSSSHRIAGSSSLSRQAPLTYVSRHGKLPTALHAVYPGPASRSDAYPEAARISQLW